jgi:3'(2'), 5'-bisphosphate nucleotidase
MFSLSDIRALRDLASEAGEIILRIRGEHHGKVSDWAHQAKADGSPVTRADHAAEMHILEGLERLGLMRAVVAEETASATAVQDKDGFYLIDPLDGTKAFMEGGDDFTVNIGFVHKGQPIMGVLHVPVLGESYYADAREAFFRNAAGVEEKITARMPGTQLDVIVNRTEDWSGRLKNYLADKPVREVTRRSSAHKLGLIARGAFDLYPRFGPTYEWDIGAGDAILRAAGGAVETLDGKPLTYGKTGFENPPFVARGKR